MEYQVPQFIEVENKIVGPLTLRQFIYIAGAGGLCIVFFSYLNIIVALILSAIVVGFAATLAFYKINGKPFITILEAGFNYYTGDKFFLWKHEISDANKKSEVIAPSIPLNTPKLTRGKLSELAWSLDIKSPGPRTQNQQ